jgi:cysteine desulfurase
MDIYLDHNATSVIDVDALKILESSHRECYGNPSSTHSLGRKAKARYLNAKDTLASFFKVTSSEIFFTRSATEAINWLLFQKTYKHIISTNLEHAATFNSLKELERRGTKVTFMAPGLKGYVNKSDLENALTSDTDLIILGSANSETGIIQDTKELSFLAYSRNIPFYVDAVGLLGKGIFQVDPHVTAYIISSHKIHGPKGIAALIHKKPELLEPLLYGGYQENNKIAGTESLPQILGFACAFKKLIDNQQALQDIQFKRDLFELKLTSSLNAVVIGQNERRVFNTSCILFKDISGETLLQLLDHHHIYASHGSACSSGAIEPSRVLVNMGLKYSEAKQSLRFSLSKFTSDTEIDTAITHIVNIVQSLKNI